jgi:hypothetical protein
MLHQHHLGTNTIWGARNDILHSITTETTAIVQLRINTTIYQIYADKDTFKDADRQRFFRIPVQTII